MPGMGTTTAFSALTGAVNVTSSRVARVINIGVLAAQIAMSVKAEQAMRYRINAERARQNASAAAHAMIMPCQSE